MMAWKAHWFDDDDSLKRIMESTDPRKIKAMGRHVLSFNGQVWDDVKEMIVGAGNYAKFTSCETLKGKLLATGDRELVEASPFDKVWGVGCGAKAANRANLLGKVLMKVREIIRDEEDANVREMTEGMGGKEESLTG
jgi:ribA/ribD-fused uncharacterized protein